MSDSSRSSWARTRGDDDAVALARACLDTGEQLLGLAAVLLEARPREAVRQVGEAERAARGDPDGVGDRLGQVGPQPRHGRGRAQAAGAVDLEAAAGGVEGAVLAQAGEDVRQRRRRRVRRRARPGWPRPAGRARGPGARGRRCAPPRRAAGGGAPRPRPARRRQQPGQPVQRGAGRVVAAPAPARAPAARPRRR